MVVATEEGSRAVEGKAEVVGMEEVVVARRVGSVAAALATEVSGKSHVAAMAERMEAALRVAEMEPVATGRHFWWEGGEGGGGGWLGKGGGGGGRIGEP